MHRHLSPGFPVNHLYDPFFCFLAFSPATLPPSTPYIGTLPHLDSVSSAFTPTHTKCASTAAPGVSVCATRYRATSFILHHYLN